jgi:hypothetical protein
VAPPRPHPVRRIIHLESPGIKFIAPAAQQAMEALFSSISDWETLQVFPIHSIMEQEEVQ